MSENSDLGARTDANGLLFLFSDGDRPTAKSIQGFVERSSYLSVSFNPAVGAPLRLVGSDQSVPESNAPRSDNWLELLSEGLTFDLGGLGKGEGAAVSAVAHHFDCDRSINASFSNAVCLRLGGHLSGGEGSLPVIRSMMRIARDIVQHFEQISAVVWEPSSSAIGRRFFESTVTAFLEGGAFPALGLTAFQDSVDGGLESVGLSHFIGQELRIEPDLAADKVYATRLGVRLVNQLVLSGAIEKTELIIAPDGRQLRLEPSGNGRFIRIWSG